MSLVYIFSFIASLLLSFVLTRFVRNITVRRGWAVSTPLPHHIHNSPIPRIGGVAIFLSFIAVAGLVVVGSYLFGFNLNFSRWTVVYIVASGILVFLLGLYDDIRSVSPYLKLAVQSLAAVMLFFWGFRVLYLPLIFGSHEFGWTALPLTIFWVLWITNAFNLIDGLDGLASGSALFSTLTVFVIALFNTNHLVALLTVILAGSILGFLRFNFNPATIFLGDCGSLFIGFMLSALALVGSHKTPTIVAVAIPVVSFGLPILETTLSVIRRFLNGQPLFSGDREHIHHKLMERGLSQRQVVITLYAVSAGFGLLSLLLLYPGMGQIGVVLFVLGVGVWLAVQHLGYHEFFEIGRVAHRTVAQKRIIINNLAIRRATAELAKAASFDHVCQVLGEAFKKNDFDGYQIELAGRMESEREAEARQWHRGSKSCRLGEVPDSRWTLTLELMTADKPKLGRFSLYREYSDKPLLVDINLLTTGFHAALSEAIARATAADLERQIQESVAIAAAGDTGEALVSS